MNPPLSDPRHERVDVRLSRALRTRSLPKELLLCGPAGTGKTFAALVFLHLLLADVSGLRVLVCRQTRRSLTESVLATFEKEVLPRDGMERLARGAGRGHRDSYHYPNGSDLVVAGLDRPDRALSTAWDIIYVNEATETEEAAWDTLSSRLDRPGRDPRFGFLLADTNPGDPSHWLKTRGDDGRTALWDTTHRANPLLHDGADWTADGRRYLARLGVLRGSRRKRLLDGLWAASEGVWFDSFGPENVTTAAAYDPLLPVTLAVDSGVYTGAVAFQVRPTGDGVPLVTVFYDYLAEGVSAFDAAGAILRGLGTRKGSKLKVRTDPAGSARNPIGPTVLAEYARAGLAPLDGWPGGPVADGLALVEALVAPQKGTPRLLVHPDCKPLCTALGNYRRAKRHGQWQDAPEDPQHPHEDLVDALRGGLRSEFPEGLKPKPSFKGRRVSGVFS